jgi:glycosyltransferase involved in cell wall biosynthesis
MGRLFVFSDKIPKISCVMVTCGRIDRVSHAIRSWCKQTYPKRELIILSQGGAEVNRHIDEMIKFQVGEIHFVEAPARLSLGAMRNASIELSTGDVICQWDDDDLYSSKRLMTQYKAMLAEDAIASLYTQFLKFFEPTRKLYWTDWSEEHNYSHRFLCGSIMFYKRLHHECGNLLYPEHGLQSDVEEDLHALEKILSKGRIAGVDQGEQYVYCYHGQNTYDLAHHELGIDTSWKKTLKAKGELLAKKPMLENVFKEMRMSGPIEVMAENELAFTYLND